MQSLKTLIAQLLHKRCPNAVGQEPERMSRFVRDKGPMYYLGQQIVQRMETMGYPSRIYTLYRTPAEQTKAYKAGRSKAKPYQSPHQFLEAVDIVHKLLYWEAPPEYWDALALCVREVAKQFNVELEHGHTWKFVDSAHVEIRSWRDVRTRQVDSQFNKLLTDEGIHYHKPTQSELYDRFVEILPNALKQEYAKVEKPHESAADLLAKYS